MGRAGFVGLAPERSTRGVLGEMGEQAFAECRAVGRQPLPDCGLKREQPIARLAEQVDDLAALEHREVARLLNPPDQIEHVPAGEVGQPHAREQRWHQSRQLEPEPQPAVLGVALEKAAIGEDVREPMNRGQGKAQRLRDLGLGEIPIRGRERAQDVEASSQRAYPRRSFTN